MSRPIYVAIDTPELSRAKDIAVRVRNHVGGIKLGLEFFTANGRSGVPARSNGRSGRAVRCRADRAG